VQQAKNRFMQIQGIYTPLDISPLARVRLFKEAELPDQCSVISKTYGEIEEYLKL